MEAKNYEDYTHLIVKMVGELGIKKGRGLLDLSLLSDAVRFSLEPAAPAASISPTAIATTTRAGGLGFGFVDCQRSATKLRGI